MWLPDTNYYSGRVFKLSGYTQVVWNALVCLSPLLFPNVAGLLFCGSEDRRPLMITPIF